MLTFEQQQVARGVPWNRNYNAYPKIFVGVSLGGLVLDAGMFMALTFRRPSTETSRMFVALSALFHSFVCFTMSQRIGYSFPFSCMAGSILFQPIGNEISKKDDGLYVEVNHVETNLVCWTKRYLTGNSARATRWQRVFTMAWLFCQLAIPLRTPIISKGSFPYTSQGYRFSWTMMLHSHSTAIQHIGSSILPEGTTVDKILPVDFLYLSPECRGLPLQRERYMEGSSVPTQDPRSLPLSNILTLRHFALINVFPRYIARVAGGMSEMLHETYPRGCYGDRVSVFGVHFAMLNGHGAYHRLFDPTVDLAASNTLRKNRSWRQLWTDVLWDQSPKGRNVYLLRTGIGGSKGRVKQFQADIKRGMPEIKRVEFIADRAECLAVRPLALWLDGFPLGVLPLEVPTNFSIYVDGRQNTGPRTKENQWDGLTEAHRVKVHMGRPYLAIATSVEIGITNFGKTRSNITCGESDSENVIIALLFMA